MVTKTDISQKDEIQKASAAYPWEPFPRMKDKNAQSNDIFIGPRVFDVLKVLFKSQFKECNMCLMAGKRIVMTDIHK